MEIIEKTRELGALLQKDERFIAYAKAKLAIEDNKEINDMIGEFNLIRMNMEKMQTAEKTDTEKLTEESNKLRELYSKIMENKDMLAFNEAKAAFDVLMNEVVGILQMSAEGADPATCTMPESGCNGNCSSCGGCN